MTNTGSCFFAKRKGEGDGAGEQTEGRLKEGAGVVPAPWKEAEERRARESSGRRRQRGWREAKGCGSAEGTPTFVARGPPRARGRSAARRRACAVRGRSSDRHGPRACPPTAAVWRLEVRPARILSPAHGLGRAGGTRTPFYRSHVASYGMGQCGLARTGCVRQSHNTERREREGGGGERERAAFFCSSPLGRTFLRPPRLGPRLRSACGAALHRCSACPASLLCKERPPAKDRDTREREREAKNEAAPAPLWHRRLARSLRGTGVARWPVWATRGPLAPRPGRC